MILGASSPSFLFALIDDFGNFELILTILFYSSSKYFNVCFYFLDYIEPFSFKMTSVEPKVFEAFNEEEGIFMVFYSFLAVKLSKLFSV